MAIATTTDFNPDQGELFEEAFELAGLEMKTGNDIRTARRSLNYLTLEWANEGLNLWTIEEDEITLVEGTATYAVDMDVLAILDATIRSDDGAIVPSVNQLDITSNRMSQTTYAQIPAKLQEGRPNRFWFDRVAVRDVTESDRTSSITVWPVPDSGDYTFVFWSTRRMADAGTSLANTVEVPDRFLPSLLYGLAYKIAQKKNPSRIPFLFSEYTRLFEMAKEEDRVKEDLMIIPDLGP
jgi:hypothetical protein